MHCTDQFEASTLFLSPRQGAGLPENFSVVHVRRVGILNLTWMGNKFEPELLRLFHQNSRSYRYRVQR